MRKFRSNSGAYSVTPRRDGFTLRILVIAMVLLIAGGAAGWYVLANSSFSISADGSGPVFHTVERGEFIHDITERGNVESASNVEIKCQVQSQGSQGTMILWVIEEGKHVEPGDVLVKLDSSKLEDSKVKQQITCNSSKAAVIQAKSNFDTAEIAKEEYIEGTFKENKLTLENQIFSAKEALRQAQQNLEYGRRLLAKGYVTKLEVEAHEFGVKKAEKDLDARETELWGLKKYTYEKTLTNLLANIQTYQARLKSEEHSHQLDEEKLELIEEQIEACTVKAPEPGQVVYANIASNRGGSETIIEEGSYVRERQTIIRLPDPARMQVKAKINEARVALVVKGMAATVKLDAIHDQILKGEVEKVNEYPIPTSWFSGSIKEYETIIQITEENLPDGLRPGLTAEIKIRVARTPNVLQVPVQTVFEHGGKHYCVLAGKNEGEWEAREVTIGSSNYKFVVIEERKEGEDKGLREGEKVVMGAFTYRDKLDLPELDSEQQVRGKSGPGSGNQEKAAQGGDAGRTGQPSTKPGAGQAGAKPGGQGGPGGARPDPAQFFKSSDTNGDGKLEKSEMPSFLQSRFADLDKNSDGFVDKSEFNAVVAAMRAAGGGGGQRPGGGRRPEGAPGAASGGSP
jgi:HlyD family secretion protein